MKKTLFVALGVLALAGLAVAATPKTRAIEHISPEIFYNLKIAPVGTCSVDFGALQPLSQATGNPCLESSTCEAIGRNGGPGASIGDTCMASTSMSADGGAALPITAQLSCRAVTDGVVFKVCFHATDGGSLDLGAAWFTGVVIKR